MCPEEVPNAYANANANAYYLSLRYDDLRFEFDCEFSLPHGTKFINKHAMNKSFAQMTENEIWMIVTCHYCTGAF